MFTLLWFSGIGSDTKMRDIGWTWVALGILIIFLIRCTIQLRREWNSEH